MGDTGPRVDMEPCRPGHGGLAHSPGNDGCMRRLTPLAGDDPNRSGHAMDVIRCGLRSNEDHRLPGLGSGHRVVGVEHDLPDSGAR
jgi:hypothetical protein